jgi:hypothetical protein
MLYGFLLLFRVKELEGSQTGYLTSSKWMGYESLRVLCLKDLSGFL